MPNLPIIPPTVPEGFCNQLSGSDWVQKLANLIVGQAVAQFDGSGFTVVLNQSTQPGSEDIDKLWRDTDTGLIYEYSDGAWVTPHPFAPGGAERRWFAGTLTELQTYDGGSAGAVRTNSGPMWEEDTDFQGKSPMHPGFASSTVTVTVNNNFGEGAHAIAANELPAHAHDVPGYAAHVPTSSGGDPRYVMGGPIGGSNITDPVGATDVNSTTATAMNIVHPVRGLYCIKRTARVNYVGS